MHCLKKITEDMYWVGGNDRRLALFENVFPVPRGVSYNSYLVLDEKTVLLDTVDKSVSGVFFENVERLLGGRKLDYLIVNHMEPDHCATMEELILRYPDVKIVCNEKTIGMIKQFFFFDIDQRSVIVKEMDVLNTGKHVFTFVMAPMVHWPEAMVTYDTVDKILYSADAFGTFGALGGNIFADEVDFENTWIDDARRYYTNIVGKYGTQVQALLKKASTLEISMICPLHGPLWRKNIGYILDKYFKWSSYTPEETSVVIAYASVYGNTENAAQILAFKLGELGIKNIKMFDVSVTHTSYIVAEIFRASHVVIASTTYNAGIFCNMETLIHALTAHNIQNRTAAIIENGTWAPTSGELIRNLISECKNINIIDKNISIKSSLKESQIEDLNLLAAAIAQSMETRDKAVENQDENIEQSAMFKLSYGLFVLTALDGQKENGCIINTVMQITDNPKRIVIGINKTNYTHDMIKNSGIFNVSILSTDVPFPVFERFGFCSGRESNKFEGTNEPRTSNGLRYVPEYSNAVISAKVTNTIDCTTHTLFVADVTEAKNISDSPSVTYQYYFDHIKPKPRVFNENKKGYVCKICGYVYEGDILPEDFICPLCKHGAEDFERIG